MKELLEAGVHFGHQTRRWNPKMKPFIYGGRNGIYIVDLHKTLVKLEEAYEAVRDIVAGGGRLLFVGTKKQAQESIQAAAMRCSQHWVNQRWLGGMLTNIATIRQRVAKLREYEELMDGDEFALLPKNDRISIQKQREKLERYLTGVRDMNVLPNVIFIVDLKKEHIAVKEARKLEIPIVAVVDTNCDPDEADFPVPGNDDAIRAIRLISNLMSDACLEGAQVREKATGEPAEGAGGGEKPESLDEHFGLAGRDDEGLEDQAGPVPASVSALDDDEDDDL